MKVCIVGSGAREHALAVAMSETAEVVVAPGNPGMVGIERIDAPPERLEADLWVIGPEAPLVDGIADRVRARGGLCFGPGADGARLEGSKAWMKELLVAARVPTAGYQAFDEAGPALQYLPGPWAIKPTGWQQERGSLLPTTSARPSMMWSPSWPVKPSVTPAGGS